MIVNTNPDFYKLFKSCVRWRDPSHTPAFLIIHEGGKPVKSETGFFWGEGGVFSLPARPDVAVSDAGGLPDWSPADLAAVVSAGVACLLCRLLPLPLVVFVAPISLPPFPGGEERSASAVGGMGATKQAKGRGGRRQRRQAPRRVQRRHGQPAPQGASPAGCGRLPAPVPPGFSRRAPVRRGL